MVLSYETDADLEDKHTELCNKLNLDFKISNDAWDRFQSISKNFTLEVGDGRVIHKSCLYKALFFRESPFIG